MNRFMAILVGSGALALLTACGGVSEVTKERVARSETAVRQAEATVGRSEAGALELQRAKEQIEMAQRELNREKAENAERFASRAQLNADLAVAKAQSADARRAADELTASIETLRREAARGEPLSTPQQTAPVTTPEPR